MNPFEMLKACPFCGSAELMLFCDPAEGQDNSGPSRRVQCAGCNVEAPFYDTEADAIAAWNTRTPAPALAGVEREGNDLCSDCPPLGYPTDKTRCGTCPRLSQPPAAEIEDSSLRIDAEHPAVPVDALVDLPDRLCAEVRHHIREMYPKAVEAAPGTFLLSVGNHVRNKAHSAIMAALTKPQPAEHPAAHEPGCSLAHIPLGLASCSCGQPTPSTIWGGNGYEYDKSDEPPMRGFPWCVGVNGVGHYPIAWFARRADAKLWTERMNAPSAVSASAAATNNPTLKGPRP